MIYRKAIEGFNASRADKQIRIVEETETPGDERGSKTKKTTRIETQAGNANLLGKAKDAVKAMEDLHSHRGPRRAAAGGPIDLATVTDDDLDAMTDEQLYALELRVLAENGADEGPTQTALTPAELRAMSDEQLRALHAQLLAGHGALAAMVLAGFWRQWHGGPTSMLAACRRHRQSDSDDPRREDAQTQ